MKQNIIDEMKINGKSNINLATVIDTSKKYRPLINAIVAESVENKESESIIPFIGMKER